MLDTVYGPPTAFDDAYPKRPYNFDVPPPEYTVGPIKTILRAVTITVDKLTADVAFLNLQMSVQTATGVYLDNHGVLYNTPRLPGEIDDSYRPRILAALTTGKLTIQAIQRTVEDYLLSVTPNGLSVPTAIVYDLQSNPAKCALDAAAGYPIRIFQFVVEITESIGIDEVFFLNYSYLSVVPDDPLTLFDAATSYSDSSSNPALVRAVNSIKAANTRAIFKNVVNIDTGP